MTVEKVLVKDSEGTFEEKLICFPGKVPDELLCVVCKNISSKLLEDGHGHIYCQSCVYTLDDDGKIQWDIDDTTYTTYVNQLKESNSAFDRALKLTAKCPKEGCLFEAALRDLFDHYPLCRHANPECPLCHVEMHPRALAHHIAALCDYRILPCPYCTDDYAACHLENHLDVCESRPATCEHCQQEFDTFSELRDKHMDVCCRRPEKCPYEKIGCEFQAVAQELQTHVGSSSDARLLVNTIGALTAKVEQLTQENKMVLARLQDLEDKQKEEAFLRTNVEATTEELSEELKDLRKNVAAPRKEPELEKRLAKLEQTCLTYQKPFEQLVRSIADLK